MKFFMGISAGLGLGSIGLALGIFFLFFSVFAGSGEGVLLSIIAIFIFPLFFAGIGFLLPANKKNTIVHQYHNNGVGNLNAGIVSGTNSNSKYGTKCPRCNFVNLLPPQTKAESIICGNCKQAFSPMSYEYY